MDWDRVEDLLSHRTQRLMFVDSTSFLLGFFETLFKALKDCGSVDQCSSLYPRAGPLLTTFATHPYIGCDEKLVSLIIDCIVEYTKHSFNSTVTPSDLIPRSSTWCLQRLRRISCCSILTEVSLLPWILEQKAVKIASNIQEQSKKGNLTITKMEQLCDMSLLLLEDDTTFIVIEALMDAALELGRQLRNEKMKHDIMRWNDNDNDTAGTDVLHGRFTQYVLDNMNNENGSYQRQWPIVLKTKAWQTIPDLFECEWMDWVEKQLDSDSSNTSMNWQIPSYSTSSMVTLIPHPLLQGLKQCPRLMYASFTLMARWIFDADLADWQIVRLWIKVMAWHSQQQQQEPMDSLPKWIESMAFPSNLTHLLDMMMVNTAPSLSLTSCHVDQFYSGLVSFIYEGSPLTLTRRRNQAWLLSLMCPLYNFRCIVLWVGWCVEDESVWPDQMDQLSKYIAWLVCPSLDKRMDSYYYGLKKWILALKGFDRCDPSACGIVNRFFDSWYFIFNGQIQMGVDILAAIIHHSQNWTADQCISVINRFLNGIITRGESTGASVTVSLLERLTALDDARMEIVISHVHSSLP